MIAVLNRLKCTSIFEVGQRENASPWLSGKIGGKLHHIYSVFSDAANDDINVSQISDLASSSSAFYFVPL